MADVTRPLNKVVTEDRLTAELKALPGGSGIFGISCVDGYTSLIVHNGNGLTPAQIDAAVVAHVPKTATEVRSDGATTLITRNKDLQALVLCLVDAINQLRQSPTTVFPALTAAQVKQAFIDKRTALG